MTGVTAGAEVIVMSDGATIGTAVATSDSVVVESDAATTLDDGAHDITAIQVVNGGQSLESEALPITIDTVAPAPLDSTAPDTAQILTLYSFDADSPDEGSTGVTYSLVNPPDGMTIDAATGLVSWTPTAEQAEPVQFEIQVSDLAGNVTSQTVELTVLGVIPAYPDQYTIAEDDTLVVDAAGGVLANDGNQTSGTLSSTVVSQPTHGTLNLATDGSFTYTPDSNYFGTDSFTYMATDGVDNTNIAKVTFQITAVNDPAVPVSDQYTATEDVTLNVDAQNGLLANDTDVDGDSLTAALVDSTSHGTIDVNADGSFTYVPDANYNGTDSFTYAVDDGTSTSSPTTVTIAIEAVNNAPTAVADSYTVDEDTTLTVSIAEGVLANDTDVESDTLTAAITTTSAHGTVTLAADGSFVYVPNADYFGTDSFTYTASDGVHQSTAATVAITVAAQADPPAAVDDSATAGNDGSATVIDVLANDSSAPDATQSLSIVAVTQGSSGGTVAFTADSIAYTAPVGFVGTDTFSYTITDTDQLQSTATVSVSVAQSASSSLSGYVFVDLNLNGHRDTGETGVPGVQIAFDGADLSGSDINRILMTNDDGYYRFSDLPAGTYQIQERQPTAMADGGEETTVDGAGVDNDLISNIVLEAGQDATGNNFAERGLYGEFILVKWFFASSLTGSPMLRETIAWGEEQAGNTDLAQMIRDGSMESEGPPNANPVATGDTYSVDQDSTLSVTVENGVLQNDTDADGDPLTASVVTGTTHGTLSLSADGAFTYTPESGYTGTDSFTYQANDGSALSDAATVSITVNAVNHAPVGAADSYSVAPATLLDVSASQGVLANDQDVDGDTLTVSLVSDVSHGTLSLGSDGAFTYTAEDGFVGTDAFSYQVSDTAGSTDTATVSIVVQVVNNAPVSQADSYTLSEDGSIVTSAETGVLINDSDADSDLLTATLVSDVSHGALTFNSDGSFTYTPAANFNGTDTFSYMANDGVDDSAETLVTMTVEAVDDPVVVSDDSYTVDAGTQLDVAAAQGVLANDTDVDGDTLSVQLVSDVTHGTLSLSTDGSFTYVADDGFVGTDLFTYQVDDGTSVSDSATVSIVVKEVNQTPSGVADSYTMDEDGSLVTTTETGVLANDTDADSDPLTATLISDVSHGELSLSADGSFSYTPDANYNGTDSFSYVANDGHDDSSETVVTITINPVDDPVVVVDDTYTVTTFTELSVTSGEGVLATDEDVDGDTLSVSLDTDVANGTLVLNTDGSFSYTSDEGFVGTDSFTYTVNDGTADYGPATVSITVLAEDLVQYRMEVTTIDGTPVTTVTQGDSFLVNVYVEDLRSAPDGVFAGFLDILFDSSAVSINGDITFGDNYQNGKQYDVTTPGLIDEIGAFSTSFSPIGAGEFLLVSIPMQADAVGSVVLNADTADEAVDATLLYNYGADVPTDQLRLIDASIEILAAAGEGESAGGGYTDAADAVFTQLGS